MEEKNRLPETDMEKKRKKKPVVLMAIIVISALACLGCAIAYQVTGSYVTEDGMVVESFGFVPLAFLFGLIALISAVILLIRLFLRRRKEEKTK